MHLSHQILIEEPPTWDSRLLPLLLLGNSRILQLPIKNHKMQSRLELPLLGNSMLTTEKVDVH